MLIAGLTGGLACGKSFIAAEFARLGCYTVEADELGHHVLLPGGEAYESTLREFGTVDRSALAQMVFGDPEQLRRLNAIVHPAVRERSLRLFRQYGERDTHAIVIYVAAILVETGSWRDFDKLIVADCSRETQISRAVLRSGSPEAAIAARLDRQLPAAEKLRCADYVIDTNGTTEETVRQTKMVYEELRKLAS